MTEPTKEQIERLRRCATGWAIRSDERGLASCDLEVLLDAYEQRDRVAAERQQRIAELEREIVRLEADVRRLTQMGAQCEVRLRQFLDGYHGASEEINKALGTGEAFDRIDREMWECGCDGWARHVVAKVEHLKARLREVVKALIRLERHDPPLNHEIGTLVRACLAAAQPEGDSNALR